MQKTAKIETAGRNDYRIINVMLSKKSPEGRKLYKQIMTLSRKQLVKPGQLCRTLIAEAIAARAGK